MSDLIKKGLVEAARILDHNGLGDLNQGQISCRIPNQQDVFYIKKALTGFGELNQADFLVEPYAADQKHHNNAPPELPLHQAIYAARSDVRCIIHTHSEYATLFSAFDWEIVPVTHDGAYFVGDTALYKGSSQTVLDYQTGELLAKALADKRVLFMRNHGVVITGKTVKEATVAAVLLEKACRLQLWANQVKETYHVSNAEDVEGKKAFNFSQSAVAFLYQFLSRELTKGGVYEYGAIAK